MRHEVHVHADVPILEGVSRRQIEQAFAPLLEYLDADGLGDVKSLEPDEPGIKYDEKELILTVCWTGEIGRSFHPALDVALENLGPYCYEAVEVDVTMYHDNGEQESKLLFVGPTAHAIHEAQRRCMIEDVVAVLARQFEKDKVGEVTALVNDLFDRDWKEKASQQKKPERAFESYTRPSRKNLHYGLGRTQVPRIRHPRAARRPVARPGDRQPRGADLPDHVVRLPRHRARRVALQHGARRPRLFAHLESDRSRSGGARRRARRWRRRDCDGLRPGGAAPGDRDADGRGQPHRRLDGALWRLAQPARLYPQALRHRHEFRFSQGSGEFPARPAAQHETSVWRNSR